MSGTPSSGVMSIRAAPARINCFRASQLSDRAPWPDLLVTPVTVAETGSLHYTQRDDGPHAEGYARVAPRLELLAAHAHALARSARSLLSLDAGRDPMLGNVGSLRSVLPPTRRRRAARARRSTARPVPSADSDSVADDRDRPRAAARHSVRRAARLGRRARDGRDGRALAAQRVRRARRAAAVTSTR